MNKHVHKGYRGYIGSRNYRQHSVPQQVQNLVIRDYCQRNNFDYLLSATEYHMAGCYIMLEELIDAADDLDGIVLYSLFMLPRNRKKRHSFVQRARSRQCSLHGALENLAISGPDSWAHIEDIFAIDQITQHNAAIDWWNVTTGDRQSG